MKPLDVFADIPCLTIQSQKLDGIELQKKWFKRADKRIIGQYLQKFIDYNKEGFHFLGANPLIRGTDQNVSLSFATANFIGAIPLRSSDNGKQIGDLVISPRYIGNNRFQDYIEILNLLEDEVNAETLDSLPLASGRNFRPPFYLEAIKFLSILDQLVKMNWRKFNVSETSSAFASGNVNWNKFAMQSFDPSSRLAFPSRRSYLSQYHSEFSQLKYVFEICKLELASDKTPIRVKQTIKQKLNFLNERLYSHTPLQTNNILTRSSDSQVVKNCKKQANKILNFNFTDSIAWRVDFAEVFEKFVQHVFTLIAEEHGAKLLKNYRFSKSSEKHYSWELKHLEADAIFKKDDTLVMIDAKYKSNLLNKFQESEILKEGFRHDLHQILAYSSFNSNAIKQSIICYPSSSVESKDSYFRNALNEVRNRVTVIGVPLNVKAIPNIKKEITKILNL